MKTVAIVVIVLVVLLVIVLAVLAGRRNKRRAALRERFGPEYDLAVKRGKDRRAVEQRLEQLAKQRDQLDIRDVPVQEHVRFQRDWDGAQSRFVDDPGQSVADADGLVNSVLRSRGYPVDSFDDRAALLATDHQDVVEGYRSAHDTFAAHLQGGSTDTESLRKAFLDYREVFGRLNVPDGDVRELDDQPAVGAAPVRREVEAAPSAPSLPAHAEPGAAGPAHVEQGLAGAAGTEGPRHEAEGGYAEDAGAAGTERPRHEAAAEPVSAEGTPTERAATGDGGGVAGPEGPYDSAVDRPGEDAGHRHAAEGPVGQGPVGEGPVAEGPVDERPVDERPVGSVGEGSVGEGSVGEGSVDEGSVDDERSPQRRVGAHRADPA